ncbi:MAG TPA: HAMP domain-containing sensor histidine kinase [Acidimicrobiia bacterium]|nr:HAMP domain-containing sensor histidine kinase [Acidimicrobiia bacterium]
MKRRTGLRQRLVWSLIGVVALTVVIVGVASVVLVDRSLRNRLVQEALAATEFNLTVLAPATGLPPQPTSADIQAAGLLDRFLRRGTDGAWVRLPDGETVAAGVAPVAVSESLTGIVDRGQIAYEFTDTPDGPVLVTASRLPPTGPDFYFVTSARPISDATRQVLLVVSGAGIVAILLGAVISSAAARRMLRPVGAARQAAERMAAGDLDVRLTDEGSDEFGRLSDSFNHMADSLQETIRALDAAHERERRFVADVSHELRTPLTGLVNEARMLLDRLKEDATVTDGHRTLATMLDSDVTRLRRLVEDLLEISRLDSDQAPAATTPVDIPAFLGALIAQRHPGALLSADLTQPVITDPRALERIVGNLLDNARIHAEGAETTVTAHLAEDALVIEVSDQGPGVDSDSLERIFDRFATVDASRSGGTGLGLAIVARHVSRLGGSVEAGPGRERGLRVTVRLPVGELLHDGDRDAMFVSHSGGNTA